MRPVDHHLPLAVLAIGSGYQRWVTADRLIVRAAKKIGTSLSIEV
jgi:hypothetical protein